MLETQCKTRSTIYLQQNVGNVVEMLVKSEWASGKLANLSHLKKVLSLAFTNINYKR